MSLKFYMLTKDARKIKDGKKSDMSKRINAISKFKTIFDGLLSFDDLKKLKEEILIRKSIKEKRITTGKKFVFDSQPGDNTPVVKKQDPRPPAVYSNRNVTKEYSE